MNLNLGLVAIFITLFIIIGAVATRRCVECMIVGSMVAAIFLGGTGFLTTWSESLQNMLAEHVWVMLVCLLFGGLISLLTDSKGSFGFSKYISKFCNSEKKTLMTTFVMGILIFVDDYLNVLSIGACMKKISDKQKLPRESLAYILDSTGAPVCVLLPFSTWAVFYASLFYEQESVQAISGVTNAMSAYVKAIPFCFYPIVALIVVFLFAMGWMPKLGAMKKAYKRVEETGKVYSDASRKYNHDEYEDDEDGNIWNFLIPMGVLVGVAVVTFVLKDISGQMGMTEYIIELAEPFLFASIFPAMVFLLGAILAFTTGSDWGMSSIITPIVFPLGAALGANPVLIMAAIISGGTFGSHACFYADATLLASQSSGVENMEHALSQIPYVIIASVISVACFVVAGFIV